MSIHGDVVWEQFDKAKAQWDAEKADLEQRCKRLVIERDNAERRVNQLLSERDFLRETVKNLTSPTKYEQVGPVAVGTFNPFMQWAPPADTARCSWCGLDYRADQGHICWTCDAT